VPFDKGGKTTIENGQALCPTCNLKKGNKGAMTFYQFPSWFHPRKWQQEALIRYNDVSENKRNFLLVATPGAGKTFFSGMVIAEWFEAGRADFVVVVAPTHHLRRQWADRMNDLGFYFLHDWLNRDGPPPPDVQGICITYQQAASDIGRELLRRVVSQRNAAAVLDEIHHAGESMSWGEALKYAFEFAPYRLLLSGTPFRSDNNPIPYVEYDSSGHSQPDYNYGYGDALRDQDVVRYVFFPSYEGNLEWVTWNGAEVRATFGDYLPFPQMSERLRTAISHRGNWLRDVIREAHAKLMSIRSDHENGDPRAGGLIIAMDQNHARGIGKLIAHETGTVPVVVISDMDEDSSSVIENYQKGDTPWIVAVKMVSEGVDIPRLRVGIYATNVTTELFFRQAVGRLVRWQSGFEDQNAYFYIPRDERLVQFALSMRDERDHVLREELDREGRSERDDDDEDERDFISLFTPISAEAEKHNTIVGKGEYSPEELSFAESIAARIGFGRTPREVLAAAFREAGLSSRHNAQALHDAKDRQKKAKHEVRSDLRRTCARLAAKYAAMVGIEPYEVHVRWQNNHGGMKQARATQDDLKRKRAWLLDLIRNIS
jgi:superfamily II DNA or RNA helicase